GRAVQENRQLRLKERVFQVTVCRSGHHLDVEVVGKRIGGIDVSKKLSHHRLVHQLVGQCKWIEQVGGGVQVAVNEVGAIGVEHRIVILCRRGLRDDALVGSAAPSTFGDAVLVGKRTIQVQLHVESFVELCIEVAAERIPFEVAV